MPRRKPISHKQRKAQLQEKRAIKRGDISLEAPKPSTSKSGRRRVGPSSRDLQPSEVRKIESSRRHQSAFPKHSREFLARSKLLADTVVLPRPITESTLHVPHDIMDMSRDLECPRRPKWRYDMSKKEVESNETRLFEQWREKTRTLLNEWQALPEDSKEMPPLDNLRSPSYYEHNLEVWRQLWRVTEISSILLVLLDTRCPPLHIPPSLYNYISSLRPSKQVILVLTKTGVVGEECATAWRTWLAERYPAYQVILTESYRIKEGDKERKGQGSRKRYEPNIPINDLESLVDALKQAHESLLTPPAHIQAAPDKLSRWQPKVRRTVDWNAVIASRESNFESSPHDDMQESSMLTYGDSAAEYDDASEGTSEANDQQSLTPITTALTVGLIGQPNVGKSSLLNALFGTAKVKASRTPGKTKHFQTLFWTPEIRLVDCPGLVFPSHVSMELQTLCSILPISQISTIPSCIHYIGAIMPLEEIFKLKHPSLTSEPVEDKRTWRTPRPSSSATRDPDPLKWTAMDIMTASSHKNGWVTAKAGRPDIHRAGNAILRAVAENKVRWAFWPPGYIPTHTKTKGIWITDDHPNIDHFDDSDVEDNDNYSEEELREQRLSDATSTISEASDSDSMDVGTSRFSALEIEDLDVDDGSPLVEELNHKTKDHRDE